MDVNNISNRAGKRIALPCVAQFVRILLVDYDTTSPTSFASQCRQQLYEVATTESATMALSLFQAQKNYYNIIIADIHMIEMKIAEFLQRINGEGMTIPIIVIAKDSEIDFVKEALASGACYVFSKTPTHNDIITLWQHIPRVTGKFPSLINENDGNHSDGSNISGAARNQKQKNIKMKMINTDGKNIKRKNNNFVGNPNSEDKTIEDGGYNSKKTRLTWTSYLHEKFLCAVNILGEKGAQPKAILKLMNEPDLTHHHVASHLQKYRQHNKKLLDLQRNACQVMPNVLTTAPLSNGCQTLNQEPARDFGNAGNMENMNNDNFGEGTSGSNQHLDEMSTDDIDQMIQELEDSEFNIWDLTN